MLIVLVVLSLLSLAATALTVVLASNTLVIANEGLAAIRQEIGLQRRADRLFWTRHLDEMFSEPQPDAAVSQPDGFAERS